MEVYLIDNIVLVSKVQQNVDFPGGLVVKTPCFQCRVWGFDSWLGKVPYCWVVWPKKKKKRKKRRLCNKVIQFGTPLQYSCLANLMDGGAW